MPPVHDELPIEQVSKDIIRKHFNEGQYYERMKSNEFTEVVSWQSHPEPPPEGEPWCTYSQFVYYHNQDGEWIAMAHQYLRPDGSIGASGLPDPKALVLEDRVLWTP